MLQAPAIIQRLRELVPELRSVDGALEAAALQRAKVALVGKPIAHVIPTGARAQRPDVITGAFSQTVDLTFAVIVTIPVANDATGAKTAATIDRLLGSILAALLGWGPEDAPGVIAASGWSLMRLDTEAVAYSIDFYITDLLRN